MAQSPAVSVLLLAYEQAHVIGEAVAACLAQEGGPYELIFSDDASTDGTYEKMLEAVKGYGGPHRIVVRRNRRNLGIGRHYNELFSIARGQLFVTAAGDDISLPDRVTKLLAAWERSDRTVDLIASHVYDLDAFGRTIGVIEVDDLSEWRTVKQWALHRPYVIGAGHAFTRRLVQRFGPFRHSVSYEDQITTFRAIASGGAAFVPEPLVRYRRGGTSKVPDFPNMESMFAWNQRQVTRHLAEMYQLLDDAARIGVTDAVHQHVQDDLRKAEYMDQIAAARDFASRVRVIERSDALPFFWKWRRALHFTFPQATFRIKKATGAVQRRRTAMAPQPAPFDPSLAANRRERRLEQRSA